ncbi:MAG: hypothetical protein COV66_07375 [Nitrospinae bacterium CG11_big_fil_rev_8_21_14_0_20_45_15]|nr:MAG: hypothetical protein COV66_07375 [Nitrospinae bacterium CG11_big_fil_rev_8_21_14_0_20_45_15]
MTDHNEKEEMLVNELSVKLREMMKHGDAELKEMVRETIRGLHNFMMDDPKSRADMKSKEKGIFSGKVIPFPTGLLSPQTSESSPSDEIEIHPQESRPTVDRKRLALVALISGMVLTSIFVILLSSKSPTEDGKFCRIKGNVNAQGEKIFHMPGDQWYDKTTVDDSQGRGERWFCSEQDALAAGFRRTMH